MSDNVELAVTVSKEDADAKARIRDLLERVSNLGYNAVKTRDGLRVVIAALDAFEQTDTFNGMDEADSSLIFGASSMLEILADECDKAAREWG